MTSAVRWIGAAGLAALAAAIAGLLLIVCCADFILDQATAASTSTAATGSTLNTAKVPAAYVALIEKAATTCSILTAPLLAAQFYQESGFNPNAVSDTGAEGITQFEPDTWTTWASPSDGDGKENPFNPADEIPAAARYDCALAQQTSKVPGDAVGNMLAAYNAGPGAVLAADGIPDITQTQDYVKDIEALIPEFTAASAAGASAGAVVLPVTGTEGLPSGFSLPAGTPASVVTAVEFADEQLGKPYVVGGTGPDSYDCSGLVQAAYLAAGISIDRTTYEQVGDGTAVSATADLEPGDLVLIPGSDAVGDLPGHVGIYVGTADGQGWIIQAPHTGTVIQATPLQDFQPIWAMRRIVPWP